ncbi:MAG: LemA family protein, partial [Phycisphaerales bacterium]|nr:LemA family protein [Phycisphaerales bacterium]
MAGLSMNLMVAIGVAALVVIVIAWIIMAYNALVRKRIDVDNAWSGIDVQLKRRYDLIPNLVNTVKGYAAHESKTLEAVMAARSRALSAGNAPMAQRAEAENMFTQAIGRLIAVAEAYPDLKANTNFMSLQEELSSTENKIGFSRQHYGDTVARYEETRQTFPSSIIAGAFNFKKRDYFEVEDGAVR